MVGHMKDTYHLAPLATWDPPHSLTESEEIFMSSLKCWHTHWINIFKTPRNILCRQGLLQGKRRLWSHVTRPQECLAALRLQTNSPTWSQVSFCSSGVSDAFLRMNPTPFIALTNWILMFLWWQTSEKCLVWLSKKGNILVYYTKYRRLSTLNHKFHCCLKVLEAGGQDQGVCTAGSFQGPWRRPGLSPWLADGLLLSVPLHVMFLLCVSASVSQLFLFIRTSFILD